MKQIGLIAQILKNGLCRDRKVIALLKRHIVDPTEENLKALYRRINPKIVYQEIFGKPFPEPNELVDGQIRFARTEQGQLVGFNRNEFHTLVSGRTFCGKTVLLIIMLGQAILSGAIVWLFAKAKDVRSLLRFSQETIVIDFSGQTKINPLLPPPGVGTTFWINCFADVFIQAFGLYDGTKNFLLEKLTYLYQKNTMPTIHDLFRLIKSFKFSGYSRDARYQESALNRLSGMISSLGETFSYPCVKLEDLANKNIIFEIQGLTSEQQVFIVNILLTWLFYYKLYNSSDCFHFVGVDDANLLFDYSFEHRPDRGLPIISHLVSTVRKSKVHLIVATQIPSQLGASIHANSFTKITFSLAYGKDIETMAKSMGITDPEQLQYCYSLAEREVVVKFAGRYQAPFLAYIPEVRNV
jgi:hypothetical protein